MKLFVIADSHFDALEYMRHVFPRPEFKNNDEMNAAMIQRWNSVVSEEDVVISVGDFCYTDPAPWVEQLNGHIVMIRGNHDNWWKTTSAHPSLILYHGEKTFYVVHNPSNIPEWWSGWVIHGHHHWRSDFPHINGPKKNINVAAELVNYTPVSLDEILKTENLEKIVVMARPSPFYD